jgi:hypothetical protein
LKLLQHKAAPSKYGAALFYYSRKALFVKEKTLLAPLPEEPLQLQRALPAQNSSANLQPVVKPRVADNIIESAGRPPFGVTGPENKPVDTGLDHGPGTHGARLEGNVERTAMQAPAAQLFTAPADNKHFSMSSRIFELFTAVAIFSQDKTVFDQHSADRDLSADCRCFSLADSHIHKMIIVQLHGKYLLNYYSTI